MKKEPPRLPAWLSTRFRRHPSGESIVGDIVERYQDKGSPLWFWNQVLRALLRGEIFVVKRVVSVFVLAVVFMMGFWTGKSPMFMKIEPPSVIERDRVAISRRPFGTFEFLQMQVERAQGEYRRRPTPESKQRLDDLKRKLEQARMTQRSM
jgi:hypothetical protein